MNEHKMREAFEAAMWEDALSEGAEPNLTRNQAGDYVQPWISGAWHGYQAATSATQRDAMAVAEAVRGVCAATQNSEIGKLDLAAIVEAVRPGPQEVVLISYAPDMTTCTLRIGDKQFLFDRHVEQQPPSAQQHGEPVAWIRFCSDGCYEGPIMNSAMEEVRKKSGAWTPLYPPAPECSVPDVDVFAKVVGDFEACGETDTSHEELMQFANYGWLECTHFEVTADGRAMLAAAPKGGA